MLAGYLNRARWSVIRALIPKRRTGQERYKFFWYGDPTEPIGPMDAIRQVEDMCYQSLYVHHPKDSFSEFRINVMRVCLDMIAIDGSTTERQKQYDAYTALGYKTRETIGEAIEATLCAGTQK